MADATHRVTIGYLLLPAPGDDAPPDLARCCDLLGERAPTVEPDPPRGAWFALREGTRAPSLATTGAVLLATLERHGQPGARLAFAPTPGVARLAARVAAGPLTTLAPDEVPTFLAPLAIEALGLDADATARLRLVGLHTLEAVVALPRGTLGDYLGPLGAAVEALARGEDDRPLIPRRPPLVLRARRDLDWPLADRAVLMALLGRLLAPLLARLARQGLGVTRAVLRLTVGPQVHRAVARLPIPTVAAAPVLTALLAAADDALGRAGLRVAGADEAARGDEDGAPGITAIALALVAPRPLPARQASFFDVPQGRLAQLHAGFAEARRRGDGAVGYLRPVDVTHPHPDRRYALDPRAVPPTGEAAS